MSSSRDDSGGSIAARNERGADHRAESRQWTPRDDSGGSIAARNERGADHRAESRQWAAREREGVLLRAGSPALASFRQQIPAQQQYEPSPIERRSTVRRAADQPVNGGGPTFRLGDVYAEELARLREQAHAEGFAAGHAEGMVAAESVVAEAERAAAERLAEVQARWERRLASATAALGAAATRLDEASVPVADEVRETVVGTVLTLLEDLLGRELALAESPVLDAVRRALTLCPADAPAVVRVHPDDLAEVAEEDLAALPESVRVVGDPTVERAGAMAETGARRIDAQLMAALERVQKVLSA